MRGGSVGGRGVGRAVWLIALLLIAEGARAPQTRAQYAPVPNFTGVAAGKQFRQAVNDRFSGAVATSPTLAPLHLFQLPAAVSNGQMYYLVDGTPGVPCTGGGSGALAMGVGGKWVCTAVGQTIQNVRAYGAKGDCSNLDNAAIQAALDATPNNNNGGTNPVYLPATNDVTGGTTTKCYLLGKPLFIPHGQVNLYGDGMEQTYLGTNYYGPALIAGTDHLSYATSLLTGPGNALDLGASSGFLELSMLLRNRLAGNGTFSVEFEVKVPASPSGNVILASQYDWPYQGYVRPGLDQRGAFWIQYDANSGSPRFDFAATLSSSGLVTLNSAGNSAPAGNHAVGLYYDGAHLWACVDGVSTTPTAATGTWVQSLWESVTLPDQDGNGPITWPDGAGNFSKDSFSGQLDNVRISNIARASSGSCPTVPAAKFAYDTATLLLLTFNGCSDGNQYCLENQIAKYAVYGQAHGVAGNQAWFPVLGRGGSFTNRLDIHDFELCYNADCQGAYILQSSWSRFERLKTISDHNGFNFWYLDFEGTFDNLTAFSTAHNGLNAFEWGFSSNTPELRNLRAEQALVCFNFQSAQTDIDGKGGHCLVSSETAFPAIFSSSTGTWSDFFVDQEGADQNWLANIYAANLGPNMGSLNFLGGNLDTYGGAPFVVHEGDGTGSINFYGTLFNNFAEDQPAGEVIRFPGLLYSEITGTVWQGQGTAAANATIANAPGTCTGTGGDTNCAKFAVPAFTFDSAVGGYTTGGFLGNPAFTGAQGTFASGGTLANNYFLFTGNVYLNKGANPGSISHDDGYELSIAGASFDKSNPLTGTGTDSFIVTAPSAGIYSFTLSYGECCSAPGVLKSGASSLPAVADSLYNVQVADSGIALSNEIGNAHVEQFGGAGGTQIQQFSRASDAYSAFYSAAGTPLPTCNAGENHVRLCASDASACTNGTTYTSGGSVACIVNCNGTNWKETGGGCY
jgi:hypothetical protein